MMDQENTGDLPAAIRAFLKQILPAREGSTVPGDAEIAAMAAHLEALMRWNRRMNLTAIRDLDQAIARHVGESCEALISTQPDMEGLIVDLGSGNGYPALPLLVARPRLQGLLYEKSEKKADFIHAAIQAIARELPGFADRVTVEHRRYSRANDLPKNTNWVMMRGFPAPLSTARSLLEARPHLGLLLWLGHRDLESIAKQLEPLAPRWHQHRLRSSDAGGIMVLQSAKKRS